MCTLKALVTIFESSLSIQTDIILNPLLQYLLEYMKSNLRNLKFITLKTLQIVLIKCNNSINNNLSILEKIIYDISQCMGVSDLYLTNLVLNVTITIIGTI